MLKLQIKVEIQTLHWNEKRFFYLFIGVFFPTAKEISSGQCNALKQFLHLIYDCMFITRAISINRNLFSLHRNHGRTQQIIYSATLLNSSEKKV